MTNHIGRRLATWHKEPQRLFSRLDLHETKCADCDATVLPCLNERDTVIRCSSCRAARVVRLIAARRN